MSNKNIIKYIADETNISENQITITVNLFSEGATIPFIARYRKEKTGQLNEIQIKNIQEKHHYFEELTDRKKTVLKSIEEQKKLTIELKSRIENCLDKQTVEDIYLPYKQKRKTKADIAIEKGFKPLADFILEQVGTTDLESSPEAIEGARYIISQQISDNVSYRCFVPQ